ncbi:MAG: metallophosphoesterase [Myxococcota bacterium]
MGRIVLAVPVIGLLLFLVVAAHGYVIDRMIAEPGVPEPWATVLRWSVVALGLSLAAQPLGERLLPHRFARLIAWPASLWMGVAFLLLVALGLSEAVLWLGVDPARAAAGGAEADALATARWRALLVGGGVLAASALGLRAGLARPDVRRVELHLPRWPAQLDGFRVVQISDIHIGPILGRDFAAWLVDRVNALEPDLVAVTGDLVDGRVDLLRDEVAPFAGLKGRHGVWFVTGNHDHYSGGRAWAAEAERLGMGVLRNRHRVLDAGGARFVIAGVDDHRQGMMPGEGGEDLDAALDGVPGDCPVVLLAHDPSTFKQACRRGIDLQISGHTHGGQIWPFRYLVRLAIPFVAGVYQRGDARLYVSRGTGFWGPPMRLGAPAEITEIVLRAG